MDNMIIIIPGIISVFALVVGAIRLGQSLPSKKTLDEENAKLRRRLQAQMTLQIERQIEETIEQHKKEIEGFYNKRFMSLTREIISELGKQRSSRNPKEEDDVPF